MVTDPAFYFDNRTNVDLKDKYRVLVAQGQIQPEVRADDAEYRILEVLDVSETDEGRLFKVWDSNNQRFWCRSQVGVFSDWSTLVRSYNEIVYTKQRILHDELAVITQASPAHPNNSRNLSPRKPTPQRSPKKVNIVEGSPQRGTKIQSLYTTPKSSPFREPLRSHRRKTQDMTSSPGRALFESQKEESPARILSRSLLAVKLPANKTKRELLEQTSRPKKSRKMSVEKTKKIAVKEEIKSEESDVFEEAESHSGKSFDSSSDTSSDSSSDSDDESEDDFETQPTRRAQPVRRNRPRILQKTLRNSRKRYKNKK